MEARQRSIDHDIKVEVRLFQLTQAVRMLTDEVINLRSSLRPRMKATAKSAPSREWQRTEEHIDEIMEGLITDDYLEWEVQGRMGTVYLPRGEGKDVVKSSDDDD